MDESVVSALMTEVFFISSANCSGLYFHQHPAAVRLRDRHMIDTDAVFAHEWMPSMFFFLMYP